MIVQRITVRYKVEKVQEAIALLGKERDRATFPHAVRMYIPHPDPSDITVAEYEFENSDELEQFWGDWEAQPEAQAFLQKYSPLMESDMIIEIFDLF